MKKLLIIGLSLFLISCAATYPCGEPRAGRCQSVTESYDKSLNGVVNPEDLPINGSKGNAPCPNCGMSSFTAKDQKVLMGTNAKYNQSVLPSAGEPLIEMPKMMRVWYAPFVDKDNIYHDQQYQYMIVQKKRWNFGNNIYYGRSDDLANRMHTVLAQDTNSTTHKDDDSINQIKPTQQSMTPALNFLQNNKSNNNVSITPTGTIGTR